jgi:hypothetical protein
MQLLGWREWVSLPDLGIEHIKAKVDTGARTSALHAFFLEPFERDGEDWLRFRIHPLQKNDELVVESEARVIDQRSIRDSGGHAENRYVIETTILLGDKRVTAEVTLTDRESMLFRMLLGRTALKGRFSVDPGRSFTLGKPAPGRSITSDSEDEESEDL